jgi:hypothetical protein
VGLVLRGSPPGTALVLYVVAYGIGRFWLEFARGDSARPYLWGFSQAQWISLLLAIAVIFAESRRILPFATWHWAAAAALLFSLVLVSIRRSIDRSRKFELLHPRHLQEIIMALRYARPGSHQASLPRDGIREKRIIRLADTSRGYRISRGQCGTGDGNIQHYTISNLYRPLSSESARVLSQLIARVEQHSSEFQLIRGSMGVVHLVFASRIDHGR